MRDRSIYPPTNPTSPTNCQSPTHKHAHTHVRACMRASVCGQGDQGRPPGHTHTHTHTHVNARNLPGASSERLPHPTPPHPNPRQVALINLEGASIIGVPGVARRFMGAMSDRSINVIMITQASSEHSICVAVPEDQVPPPLCLLACPPPLPAPSPLPSTEQRYLSRCSSRTSPLPLASSPYSPNPHLHKPSPSPPPGRLSFTPQISGCLGPLPLTSSPHLLRPLTIPNPLNTFPLPSPHAFPLPPHHTPATLLDPPPRTPSHHPPPQFPPFVESAMGGSPLSRYVGRGARRGVMAPTFHSERWARCSWLQAGLHSCVASWLALQCQGRSGR